MKAAIIGGGVIGGGWAARFLLNGWDVAVFDPDPEAERKIGEVLTNARRPSNSSKVLPDKSPATVIPNPECMGAGGRAKEEGGVRKA